MNIYDISEKAGVSIATVSRVLNGNSKVSQKTREKILEVMKETGYQPNVFARGLGLNTMNTIGVLCADSSDIVLSSAVYHTEQELHNYRYNALLCCTGYDYTEKEKYIQLLLSKRVDAVILVGSNFVAEEPEKNEYIIEAAKEVPVMIVNGYLDAPNVYCTVCDDRSIMQKVAGIFLKDTEKILFMYRSLSYSSGQKLCGVQDAFETAGREWSEQKHMLYPGTIDEVRCRLKERWDAGERWDVIMTADDELAVAAYKFAIREGISVPEELQIAGYNNSKISICCDPEITSVDNHLDDSSRQAVRLLMQILKGEEVPKQTVISGDIIVRGTTKVL